MKFSKVISRGISAVEMLIGISILSLILIFATYSINAFINVSSDVSEKTQALYMAEEGLELMRYIRDNGWSKISTLAVGTTYYLDISNTYIRTNTTPEVIGNFTRNITVQNVYRTMSSYDVVASTTPGSAIDPNGKYVTVTVTSSDTGESVSLTTMLANIGT